MNLPSPKTALAAAAAAALSLTGCGGPQQAGETAMVAVGAGVYLSAQILGADRNTAALAALVVGGLVGIAVDAAEPPCLRILTGQESRRTTGDGRILVGINGQTRTYCKPEAIDRYTAKSRFGFALLGNPYTPPQVVPSAKFSSFLEQNADLITTIAKYKGIGNQELIDAMTQYIVVYTDAPKPKSPKV